MNKKQILLSIFGVLAIGGGGLLSVQPAYAAEKELQCTFLPKSICDASNNGRLENSGVWLLLIFVINIMTVGIGIVAVAAIVYAGFLYTTSAQKAEQTKKAKEMITNTVIGLISYAFLYALLQYLIPGGVF